MRSIVLGLGRVEDRDAGVGLHALRRLAAHLGPGAGVETLDGGAAGPSLLSLVEACEHLLVLAAFDGGQAPGALVELRGDELVLRAGGGLAPHELSLYEALAAARLRGRLPPHLQLIGVQPASTGPGAGLSAAVAAAVPQVLARARATLTGWGLLTPCDWT